MRFKLKLIKLKLSYWDEAILDHDKRILGMSLIDKMKQQQMEYNMLMSKLTSEMDKYLLYGKPKNKN